MLYYVFNMLNLTCLFIIMSISVMQNKLWCTVRDMCLSKCSIIIMMIYIYAHSYFAFFTTVVIHQSQHMTLTFNNFFPSIFTHRYIYVCVCLRTLVGGRQKHPPCEIFSPTNHLFVSVKFNGDHKTVTKMR